jgi:uncharacterized membrane protein YfcA
VPEPAFLSAIAENLSDPRLIVVAVVAALAGAVRGFSGFGAALVYVPLVSAAYSPPVATATMFLVSFVIATPFTIPSFARCDWPSVLPLTIAASATVPIGAAALNLLDQATMRWIMVGMVLSGLVMLIYGARYHGRPRLPVTAGVGAIAGIFGGAAQMSGPPVVVYWLGGAWPASIVRANLMVFFTLTSAALGVTYFLQGLFTARAFAVGLVAGPAYALGMLVGARLFRLASEQTFRRIAVLIVALAALLGMPIFDRFYR